MEKFSETLKNSSSEIWYQSHEDHPFVRSIGDGSLSLERFQYFMKQDYVFLIEYCKVISLAVSKSVDLEIMTKWSDLLNETLNVEMDLHRTFCRDFGISEEELENTFPDSITSAYTDFLVKTAYEGNINEIAVSLLPCQWGYDEIARRFCDVSKLDQKSFHVRWINGYNSPEYQEMTICLKQYVDTIGDQTNIIREKMQRIFYISTRHEFMFWENVWNLGR